MCRVPDRDRSFTEVMACRRDVSAAHDRTTERRIYVSRARFQTVIVSVGAPWVRRYSLGETPTFELNMRLK